MPRKRGIFGRATRALRKLLRGTGSEPPKPPEPEETSGPLPPVPEPPLPPGTPDVLEPAHERRMQDIYRRVTGGTTGYLDWREVYDPMSVVFDTNQQIERYWDMFLRSYYLTSTERGSVPRERFHDETTIPPSQMDWDLWREIKRGTP